MGERQTAPAAAPEAERYAGQRQGLAAGTAGSTAAASSPATARSTSAASTLTADPVDLEFYLAVDVIYHRSRAAFLAAAHRWFMFATIVFGSSAVVGGYVRLCGLLAAAFGAADLCFDPVGRAQTHRELARRFSELAATLAEAHVPADHAAVRNEMIRVSEDEPADFHFARIMAHNRAIKALGRDETRIEQVSFWHRTFAHLLRFDFES